MEKENDIFKAVALLIGAYPMSGLDEMTLRTYGLAMEKYNPALVLYVVKHWIMTRKEPPAIADLINDCEIASGWETLFRKG